MRTFFGAGKVLKLEGQLLEAKKEIQRLRERSGRDPSNSSTSSSLSQSMEAVNPPFLGDQFRVEEYDDAEDEFYINPETHYINGMEWINLYM